VGDEPPERLYDSYVEEAKVELLERIDGEPEAIFYERQLQVQYEDTYFHWVTARALEELADWAGGGSLPSEAAGAIRDRGVAPMMARVCRL
jgi:hypothetical protein